MAAIVEGFLDTNLLGSWWDAHAFDMSDPMHQAAIRAWSATRGGEIGEWASDEERRTDLIAIEARVLALSSDRALQVAYKKLGPLVWALAYRQLRPGRVLAWVATPEAGGQTQSTHPYSDPPKIYHFGTGAAWSPTGDAEALAAAIETSPTGSLFAGLFCDAMGDPSVDGMVVRLWSLLEALSREFWRAEAEKKAELHMVERAMTHLGLRHVTQLEPAYHCRNVFLHQGRRADEADVESIRGGLVRLAYEALRRSGFRLVDPRSEAWSEDESPSVQRVITRASDPRPDGSGTS